MSRSHLRPATGFDMLPPDTEPGGGAEPVQAGPQRYLLVSADDAHGAWLARALLRQGRVLPAVTDTQALEAQIARHGPHAVFLDFCSAEVVQDVPRALAQRWPGVPVLGIGRAGQPASLLAALRAGVHDFIDLDAGEDDAAHTVAQVLARQPAAQAAPQGRTVALLGARAGLGVTTLAVSLALLLQQPEPPRRGRAATAAAAPGDEDRGVALLDLGLPARDGLLYCDIDNAFSFVDGVRNLRRLDRTLVQSAFARHAGGAAVLPLPAALGQMREISHADAVSLIRRLTDFFAFQIVDLGGFSPVEFVAHAARSADRVFVVCDQSIGGVVSTAALLRELEARGLPAQRLALVVNQFDPQAGLPAADIAQRLGLPLARVVPARRAALLAAAGRGEMLVHAARSDPYTQAVQALARDLREGGSTPPPPAQRRGGAWQALRNKMLGRAGTA
ncbi:CpaE family protein [Xenophilus sp.]|uniref:CpaE family protein n=1 Tax=Xenophilus sp. TaxID=1873499 RepID=UPI0037DCDAB8